MQITLSNDEVAILVELLTEEVSDVRSENYHAESHNVKEQLKGREVIVKQLLERLMGTASG